MDWLRIFELVLGGVTILSAWWIGDKNVWGQRVALLSNIMWWVYIVWAGAWGFAPMEIAFSVVVVRAWLKWEREVR